MEDQDVIDAFVVGGARKAFGTTLHVEGDCLSYDGWWEAAFRIAPDTFAVRAETPPEGTSVLADVAAALAGQGMSEVEAEAARLRLARPDEARFLAELALRSGSAE